MFATGLARRAFLLLACLTTFAMGSGAARAAYPDHPITMVVPFAAGSFLEVVARMLAPQLTTILGQQIVIVNKPGADGLIGLQNVATAAPDGYTIVFSGGAELIGPALHRTFPYDPATGLRAVAPVGRNPLVVGVSAKLGLNDYKSFADYAKKNSGKLNAASSGNSTRLGSALLMLKMGFKAEIVSFDGTAQSATSVATGESDFAVQDYLSLAPFVQAGRIKVLLVADDRRYPSLPDVPTGNESGLDGFIAGTTTGIYAPGATSDEIVNKLNAAIDKVVQMPDITQSLGKMGVIASDGSMTPKQFNDFYLQQLSLWKSVVTQANIPPLN